MRVSDLVSELHNSTKAILIACSAFLVVTASVLLFLMLFPIQAKDPAVNAVVFTTETTSTTTTAELKEELFTTREPLHTLSTWGVSIETIKTTQKPDPTTTAWYDAIFTNKPMNSDAGFHDNDEYNYNYQQQEQKLITTQPVASDSGETGIPLTNSFMDSPVQTVTEVQQTIPDVPAPTDAPPSVVTDPPITAPANMDHSNLDGYAAEPPSPAPSPEPADPEISE